jgi:hypothetical protein
MANRLYIPYLNPLNFVEVDPVEIPQYLTKHMDDYFLRERLNPWQSGSYSQPWQINDTISLQFQNNIGQLQVDVINCEQEVQLSFLMQQKQQNKYEPDYFIYESNTALTPLDPGKYFFLITVGGGLKILISELSEVSEIIENSVLLEYSNRSYYGNMIFETGITPSIRIRGLLRLKESAAKDTIYEDQILDAVIIQSKPYRVWEFIVFAIPDWMIDKLTWILGCSNFRIDGKYFTKNEGAKWEETDNIGAGTLKGYKIELRESINRNSKIFTTAENENEELTIVLNTDSKGFADTSEDASSNVVQFIDVE